MSGDVGSGELSVSSESVGENATLRRRRVWIVGVGGLGVTLVVLWSLVRYESYASLYDAEYVGSDSCRACHPVVDRAWRDSPHALMTRKPDSTSVVGDFSDGQWTVPVEDRQGESDDQPAAKMYQEDGRYVMALRDPDSGEFVPFSIDYLVGYQYRQVYMTREKEGVLRRLPLQWSVKRKEFFAYWNLQEGSTPSVRDLWDQMLSQNSAWNLYCARCHTTNLVIESKDPGHRRAKTHWTNDGIACEACHGPGSQHVNYFAHNRVNRLASFLNSKFRGQPVAYITTGPKLTKGQDLSICARCHGPDIMMASTEVYRQYEPGYSQAGRINDLSGHFKEFPLAPGRRDPTVECWADGRPKGIGMLFRSFIESACYAESEVRCYDCHDAHANKRPTEPGILAASQVSNEYCFQCHSGLRDRIAQHTFHAPGEAGSFCYDCHMPKHIENLVGGYSRFTRTHTMSSIPNPSESDRFGLEAAPNACNDCHADQTPAWAVSWMTKWWGVGSGDPGRGG